MKKKCISTATLSVRLLVLFLPVFYYIVFYGTNVNYNEMHKIITVEGNKVLSLCAVIGVAVLGAAYYFLRKIPYTGRIAGESVTIPARKIFQFFPNGKRSGII